MAYDCSENERMTWAIGAFASEQGDAPPETSEDHGVLSASVHEPFTEVG